jgi:hypothetical protein
MSEKKYFYRKNGTECGPISQEEMIDMYNKRELGGWDTVFVKGDDTSRTVEDYITKRPFLFTLIVILAWLVTAGGVISSFMIGGENEILAISLFVFSIVFGPLLFALERALDYLRIISEK